MVVQYYWQLMFEVIWWIFVLYWSGMLIYELVFKSKPRLDLLPSSHSFSLGAHFLSSSIKVWSLERGYIFSLIILFFMSWPYSIIRWAPVIPFFACGSIPINNVWKLVG